MVTIWLSASPLAGAMTGRIRVIPSRVPISTTLSPGSSTVCPCGIDVECSCFRAMMTTPAGKLSAATARPTTGESASRRNSSSSIRPPANISASTAPGAIMIRSISAASRASGQMISSMPNVACRPSATPRCSSRSSFVTKQMVRFAPSRLASEQATMFTSSRRVAAISRSHCSTPAVRSTSGLVPLPATNSTSRWANRCARSGSRSTRKTSCSVERALASG